MARFCILGRQKLGRRESGPAEEGEKATRIASADLSCSLSTAMSSQAGRGEDTRR